MIASIRFWRAVRNHAPYTAAGDSLVAKLEREPRQGRKRHMSWLVELDPAEAALLQEMMDHPPTDYFAFLVEHHRADVLAQYAAREQEP